MEKPFITLPFVSVIVAFLLLAVIIIFFNMKIKKQKGARVKSKWIVLIEMFFAYFENIVEETLGSKYTHQFTPLAITMFGTVFIGNSLVLFGVFQEAATDIMFPFTWTITMFLFWNGYGIYKIGLRGFVGDFFKPMWWMFPLEIVGFITKPLTLMIRMFGNITSGFMMMTAVMLIPPALAGASQVLGLIGLVFFIPLISGLSFYFSIFEPFIQATVFTYLVLVNMSLLINEEE